MTQHSLRLGAITLVSLFAAHAATAAGSPTDFDGGLTGWTSFGDVALPAAGASQQAALTTASFTFDDDVGLGPGALNLSGQEPGAAGFDLEAFVGLAPGGLDLDAATMATEGSALRRSFSVSAGDRISFDWLLATRDTDIGLDYAFVVIDGQRLDLGSAADASQTGAAPYLVQTGSSRFEYTFQRGGEISVAFGVVDVLDYSATTALYLDNVAISAVPEPSTAALLLGGAMLLTAARRRRG